MSDNSWFCRSIGHPSRLRPFTNDRAVDEVRLIAAQRANYAGDVMNEADYPEAIWVSGPGTKPFVRLPDFFYGFGFWAVSAPCADVLRQFDLGLGRLAPVNVFQKDRATPVGENPWYCWNFGNKKSCLLAEDSKNLEPFPGDRWIIRATLIDNDLALSAAARQSPDVWIDPKLVDGLFVSDRLGQALKKAKFAAAFRLLKCRILD